MPVPHPGQRAAQALSLKHNRLAIRCGRRWGKCLPSGTTITLADGSEKFIENVLCGDVLLTLNESTFSLEAKKVAHVHDNGVKDTVRIQTKQRALAGTPNHPILTARGWVNIGDVRLLDLVAVPRKAIVGSGIAWEAVVSVGPSEESQTWDLTMEDNHNFLAEGIVTHNTDFLKMKTAAKVARGQYVAILAPDYKILMETYNELVTALHPIISQSSKTEGVIRFLTGGRIDFWTMENERAGRSRRYHLAVIDEAAFTKPNAMQVWKTAIEPSLYDYGGAAIFASNANGISHDNLMYQICMDAQKNGDEDGIGKEFGFKEYHAPTSQNPHLPIRRSGESDVEHLIRRAEAIDKLKRDNSPMVFLQEYEAEFVDWSGLAFFAKDSFMVDGRPVPVPYSCDTIYVTIDTAVKTGSQHDGTAAVYWALNNYPSADQHRLIILDWEIHQIEGASLENWLPSVFTRARELAENCKARGGFLGAFIEDKSSGSILLQQAMKRDLPVFSIDSKLTAVGKDERAISVSGYVHRGEVKIDEYAFDKRMVYKKFNENHLLNQVMGFRIGARDGASDDILDAVTYGVAIGLGDSKGN